MARRRQEPSLGAAIAVLVLILCWSQNWAHTRDAYNWGVDKIAQHEAQSIQDAVDHATLPAPSRPPQR